MNKDQKHKIPTFEHLKNAKEAGMPVEHKHTASEQSPLQQALAHEKAKTDKPVKHA